MTSSKKIRAVPPKQFTGSIFDWCNALKAIGLWDGKSPALYIDLMITEDEWINTIKYCEATFLDRSKNA